MPPIDSTVLSLLAAAATVMVQLVKGLLAGYLTQRFGLLDGLGRWLSERLGVDIRLCL